MFYHLEINITGLTSAIQTNKSREEILFNYVCPFIKKEVTILDGGIFNMSSIGYLNIFKTDKPIDSDWPIKRQDLKNDYEYEKELEGSLKKLGTDVTREMLDDALKAIEGGNYKSLTEKMKGQIRGKFCFFICSFDNKEVENNYQLIIKPSVEKYQYIIQRVDEIMHTNTITEEILKSIAKASFVIADLTDERPNCYYEVGYAQAMGKPVIILAKKGTQKHFDIAAHRWNYWSNMKDLKSTIDKEIESLLTVKKKIKKDNF